MHYLVQKGPLSEQPAWESAIALYCSAGLAVLGGFGGTGGSGAAILIDSAGPVIRNCIFSGGVVSSRELVAGSRARILLVMHLPCDSDSFLDCT